MKDTGDEFLRLFQDDAISRAETEQIHAQIEADLRTTLAAAQNLGIETPADVDIATITYSEVEASLWSDEPYSPTNIYIYMGNNASQALERIRSGKPETVVDVAMNLLGEETPTDSEKLQWVKVVEAISGQTIVSREDNNIEEELRVIAEMSSVQEAKELAAAKNGLLKAEVTVDLGLALSALCGLHDDQRVLITAILKCAEIELLDKLEHREEYLERLAHHQQIAFGQARLRGIDERMIEALIIETYEVLEARGYPLT